jgi:hypothetical protein
LLLAWSKFGQDKDLLNTASDVDLKPYSFFATLSKVKRYSVFKNRSLWLSQNRRLYLFISFSLS